MYKVCIEYGYHVVDNGAVSHRDFSSGGIHLESSKKISAKNLIGNFNFFRDIDSRQQESSGKEKNFVYSKNN